MAADQERAERIRALYESRPDLTWGRIAEHVGVKERSAWEWGKTGGIDFENAEKLAELFEVDTDYIWRGTDMQAPDLMEITARAEQIDSVDAKFSGLVQQIFERDDRHRAQMYERLDRLAESIEAARKERVEQASEVRRLLQTQSELLDTIKSLLGMDGGTTLQDHLAQEVRDALRDSAD